MFGGLDEAILDGTSRQEPVQTSAALGGAEAQVCISIRSSHPDFASPTRCSLPPSIHMLLNINVGICGSRCKCV
jgi:hypothetical protein